jgi:hypothetical protein
MAKGLSLISHLPYKRYIRLICGLAQDRRHGQKQARKQSIKALAGNRKYNKGDDGHQKVAQ